MTESMLCHHSVEKHNKWSKNSTKDRNTRGFLWGRQFNSTFQCVSSGSQRVHIQQRLSLC